MFEDSFQLISARADRDTFPQWEVISKRIEARFEEGLHRAAGLLGLKTPQLLKSAFEIEPKAFANDPGRWRSFIGEILVLFALDRFGFENFRKLRTKNTENPDYIASYKSIPFTIEVKHTVRDEGEELKAIDHKAYNIPTLITDILNMIEARLPKFESQLAVYPGHRKIAAFGFEGRVATSLFLRDFDANDIWRQVRPRVAGKIDHLLIMSTDGGNRTYLVPDLKQYSN